MIAPEIVQATMQERMRAAAQVKAAREASRLEKNDQVGHGRRPSGRVAQLLHRLSVVRTPESASV